MIERRREQSHFIRLIYVHAILVVALPNFTRALGELQNWFGHTARNPNSNQSRNRQPKKSKNQVGALEAKIRRQFLIKRALQKRDNCSRFGRKREGVANVTLSAQANIDNLLWNECSVAQDRNQHVALCPFESGGEKNVVPRMRLIKKRDIQIGIGLDLSRELIVDA